MTVTTLRIAEISYTLFLYYAQHIMRVLFFIFFVSFPIHYEWAGFVV